MTLRSRADQDRPQTYHGVVSSQDTARALGDALRRHGIYGVMVDVSDGGRVWLGGSVASREHRDLALKLAGSTSGVTDVHAEIEIARPDHPRGPL